jgi:anaerobic sulfite reductase subunit C
MEWNEEALKIVEAIPLPPMIAHYAKMDAARRARKKGLSCVTPEIARETEKGYESALGKEAVDLMRKMVSGEDVQLPDNFFVDEPEELYAIQLCPAKFGASTMEKRLQMSNLLTPLRNKLKELEITRILMDKAITSIMSHHVFRIAVNGCSNACYSPYFSDFGVMGKYRPGAHNTGQCTQCGACVAYCSEKAITVDENGPAFDFDTCVMCAGCAEVCEQGVIYTQEKGYKVVIGGTGSRHPRIAQTVAEFTDLNGVLKILVKCVRIFETTPVEGRVISFRDVVMKQGVEKFML